MRLVTPDVSSSSIVAKLEFAMHTRSFNESCLHIVDSNPFYFIHLFPVAEGKLSLQLRDGSSPRPV